MKLRLIQGVRNWNVQRWRIHLEKYNGRKLILGNIFQPFAAWSLPLFVGTSLTSLIKRRPFKATGPRH